MVSAATFAVAVSSVLGLASAAPFSSDVSPRSLEARATYTMFGGDGSALNGWPSRSQWMSFETAWTANLPVIKSSCGNLGWGPNNSEDEIRAIKAAIIQESNACGIPKEYILAIVIQESKGCVRAPTTAWGHANPGLMQSASGIGTCNPSKPITPCPPSTIAQMIHDGTSNPALGTTLLSSLRGAGPDDTSKWYRAARIYNAGRITDNNLGIGPTPCYASDIANRMILQFDQSPCNDAKIASIGGAANGGGAQTPGGGARPKMIIQGTSESCARYWTPVAGNRCTDAGIEPAMLRRLNPQLNAECTNLWAGYGYCTVP